MSSLGHWMPGPIIKGTQGGIHYYVSLLLGKLNFLRSEPASAREEGKTLPARATLVSSVRRSRKPFPSVGRPPGTFHARAKLAGRREAPNSRWSTAGTRGTKTRLCQSAVRYAVLCGTRLKDSSCIRKNVCDRVARLIQKAWNVLMSSEVCGSMPTLDGWRIFSPRIAFFLH
jgi:hypothetical protein